MPLQTGQVLNNRYRVVKLLGQGGFGAVYRAWDSNLNRPCAIKENLDTSPEAQRQFTREATVLANLSHPNLPRVTDHFILPEQGQYLLMDFVEGDDLASILRQRGPVPVAQAVTWISQVADALIYLHSRQPVVIHRDIKPANIRVTPEGRAMLVDFGLVKMYNPQLKTTLGARAVTPGYAPPEQYGQGSTDARSDIYALGATLYNILTGQEPMESVQRMSGAQMRPASQIIPSVPLHISQSLERSMQLQPTQRFQSAAEFKSALNPSSGQVVFRSTPETYAVPPVRTPAVDSECASTYLEAPFQTHTEKEYRDVDRDKRGCCFVSHRSNLCRRTAGCQPERFGRLDLECAAAADARRPGENDIHFSSSWHQHRPRKSYSTRNIEPVRIG